MKMRVAAFVAVLLVVSELPLGFTFSSTAPAFLWTNTQDELTTNKVKEAVSYQTLSPKDLAKSVMLEGGWSNLLCPSQKPEDSVDLAIVFVGRESLDISGRKRGDQGLLDLLKVSFTKSTFSLAYPYVAASEENEALQNSLVSEFAETCGQDAVLSKVGILESCASEGGNFEKLTDINSVHVIVAGSFNQILPYGVWYVLIDLHEYVVSSMEKKSNGQTPLVVFCNGGADSLKGSGSDGKVFSELISSVEQTGAKYSVLYVSDPVNVIRYPSYRQLDRFLAQKSGNASDNSTSCDGVCQIKSSLLEGLFVGLVLLIILISGLCCMAGIDTPTRFEAPQES
ncbi:hypothetical protein Ccrd_000713 [Cynara cardunculus var. scolymus]|uniref:V-type proton ATPase subunit S1/VOA1 transmembrane domain-containing protein n=1 Tax=Cynara cardunculus var. scolymus TaxID=59895 RepID=A0A103XUM8_CYNCS|nr:hypothetical protein Ccrd_000713 [Cynara cardunculus var. scolymus]